MSHELSPVDQSRRRLLSGHWVAPARSRPQPPPWAAADFYQRCSQCRQCIEHCPEHLLVQDDRGFPAVNFAKAECSFCEECVNRCADDALKLGGAPWTLRAEIGASCLLHQRVECRRCGESCPERAIVFPWQGQGVRTAVVNLNECTGCGACVAGCPVGAVQVIKPSEGCTE